MHYYYYDGCKVFFFYYALCVYISIYKNYAHFLFGLFSYCDNIFFLLIFLFLWSIGGVKKLKIKKFFNFFIILCVLLYFLFYYFFLEEKWFHFWFYHYTHNRHRGVEKFNVSLNWNDCRNLEYAIFKSLEIYIWNNIKIK